MPTHRCRRSISGSNSPRPIPIRRPCGSRRWPQRSRRHGALAAVSARADLQGAGLGHLAVQSLSRQGPLYVARPGADLRRAWTAVRGPAAVSAKQPAGGARRAGRPGTGLGRGFCARGLSRRIRRRAQYRRAGRDRRDSRRQLGQNADAVLRARKPTRSRLPCARRPRRRSGSAFSARRASSPPTANCSGATTGWKPALAWAKRTPVRPAYRARASGRHCARRTANRPGRTPRRRRPRAASAKSAAARWSVVSS